jgi:integrase
VIYTSPHKTARFGITVAIPLTAPARAVVKSLERKGEYLFPIHAENYDNHSKKIYSILNFRKVLNAAGIKGRGYSIHSWRHTAATRLAEAGASQEVRKRILGHTTDAMAEHYDHAEHLNELKSALDAAGA